MTATPLNSRDLYLRLLSYARPHWKIFVAGLMAMVILAATEPMIPALLEPLLNGTFVDKDPELIYIAPFGVIGLFFIRGLAGYASTMAMSQVGNKVVLALRMEMFDRLLTLPSSYYDDNPAGNIISKLIFNVSLVTNAATQVLTVIVKDSLTVIGLLAFLLYKDWKLTLIMISIAPVIAVVVMTLNRRIRNLSRELQTSVGDMTHILEESVRGQRVVKVFGGQDYERKRFHHTANWVRRYTMKAHSAAALNTPVVQLLAACAMAVIIWISADRALENKETLGGFLAFLTAMGLLFSPIKRLTSINEQLQRSLAAAETIFALNDEPPEPDQGTRAAAGGPGDVRFEQVRFGYATAETDALHSISFDLRHGQTLALVGESGSGKTTIASLLPRFYDIQDGSILIDGIDVREIPLAQLRQQLSLVSQDVVLFNDTVAANIAYGSHGPLDEDRLQRAAKAAHAEDFINKMPQGFDSLIGDNGVRLSGGQRQRLAIARALYKDAPVLILDEATSALDSESERHVQAALHTLMENRTTLVIAHRLSTIEHADRILVMKDGRIVESGDHASLLEQGGQYAELYRKQFAAPAAESD